MFMLWLWFEDLLGHCSVSDHLKGYMVGDFGTCVCYEGCTNRKCEILII